MVDEVSTTLPPLQKLSGPPAVTEGTEGNEFTVTVEESEPVLQPAVLLTVSVYKPLALAE